MASQSVVSNQLQYQLQSFVLENVLPSNKELGRGAYGKVFIVKYLGLSCTAKEIHALLLDGVGIVEKKAIKGAFLQECLHSSVIRHPNIRSPIHGYLLRHAVNNDY